MVHVGAETKLGVREDPFSVVTGRGLADGHDVLSRDATRIPRCEAVHVEEVPRTDLCDAASKIVRPASQVKIRP